jgi:hypothetical protein
VQKAEDVEGRLFHGDDRAVTTLAEVKRVTLVEDKAPAASAPATAGRWTRRQAATGRGEGVVRSQVKRALVAVGFTLAISVATALPAAAATSGSESVRGAIVASGVSGDAMKW